MEDENIIAVMLSGGTDSMYAAWSQMPNYNQIRLVTFLRPGLENPQNIATAVSRLKQAFPDKKITHNQIDFEDIYQKITPHEEKWQVQQEVLSQKIEPLWKDRRGLRGGRERYDYNKRKLFMGNECLQCKVAMHLAAIKYCTDHNIAHLCDGSNTEQLDDASQLEDVKVIAKEIFGRFGVNYFSPIFYSEPEERCQALYEAGITDHLDHKRLEKTHQIPSWQVQCTIPSSVLWTVCIFPWLVYDGESCNDYIEMCCRYYGEEMEKGLKVINLNPFNIK